MIKTIGKAKNYELVEYVNDVNREYTEVLMELNINGIMDTAYSYGDQRLTNERFTGWTGCYTYDPRGSVTGVTDSKGMIWQFYRYSVNGEITFSKPQYNNVYTYNVESYNSNIQAQYLRARYYSPETANFLTEDSYLGNILDPLTLNRYNYVKSSPLNYTDPSGHAVTPDTVLDVVSAIDSAATLIADPSWVNTAFLLWDIGSALIPILPGSYVVKGAKLIGKFDNAADAVKTVSKVADVLDDVGDIAQNARKAKKAGDFADLVLDSQKALDVGKVDLDYSTHVVELKKQLSICEVEPDDWGNPVNRFDDIIGNGPINVTKFDNWNDMENTYNGTVTQFIKDNKLQNSPDIQNWFRNKGTIEIVEKVDGTQTWRYISSSGETVSYMDGFIRFPDEYLHPTIPSINIGEFTGDRKKDMNRLLDILEDDYGITEIPDGYVVHHDIENGILQLVNKGIHSKFTHKGGHSIFK